jgi:hypothetical protein
LLLHALLQAGGAALIGWGYGSCCLPELSACFFEHFTGLPNTAVIVWVCAELSLQLHSKHCGFLGVASFCYGFMV